MTPQPEVCKTHQMIFYSVCGFYVFSLATIIGYVVINNNRAWAAEQAIMESVNSMKLNSQYEHATIIAAREKRFSELMDEWNKSNQEILQRLARIESKIEEKI